MGRTSIGRRCRVSLVLGVGILALATILSPASADAGRSPSYRATRGDAPDVARIENAAQEFAAVFTAAGLAVSAGAPSGAPLGLRLLTAGHGDTQAPVRSAAPVADGAHVTYQRGPITEWYTNGPDGLEQGFTLGLPPVGRAGGADLAMVLALDGATVAEQTPDALVIALANGARLRYGALHAYDAEGRALPARFELHNDRIVIAVADRAARYPIVVDPLLQQTKLTENPPVFDAYFGYATALSADGATAIVGAYGENSHRGAATVFARAGGAWQQQTLTASDGVAYDYFGIATAISGDGKTVAIGATARNDATGAVYLFTHVGATWQQQTLTASDGVPNTFFGGAIALSADGTTMFVGADGSAANTGAIYVFTRAGGAWQQQQKLVASDGAPGDFLGVLLAASNDGSVVVAGARGRGGYTGAAYVFTHAGGAWQQQELTASDGAPNAYFGISVAISGDGATVAIGANGDANDVGAAYVFTPVGGAWRQQKLALAGATTGDVFGTAVALSGDGAMVFAGAPGRESEAGIVACFSRATAWTQQQLLTAGDRASFDEFGAAIAANVDGKAVIVGAYGKGAFTGSAYAFAAVAAPTIIGITPQVGPTAGGARVTITGAGFLAGASVTLGNVPMTDVSVVNATTITATTPPHAAATVNVVVTNPDGQTRTLPLAYAYGAPTVNPPPRPPVAPVGTAPPPLPGPRPVGTPDPRLPNPAPLPR